MKKLMVLMILGMLALAACGGNGGDVVVTQGTNTGAGAGNGPQQGNPNLTTPSPTVVTSGS